MAAPYMSEDAEAAVGDALGTLSVEVSEMKTLERGRPNACAATCCLGEMGERGQQGRRACTTCERGSKYAEEMQELLSASFSHHGHLGVQALSHLHPAVSDENGAIEVDVDQRPRLRGGV